MQFKCEFSEYKPWAGAVDTYSRIEQEGKLEELELVLEDFFSGEVPTETEINDLLWFEPETLFEALGIEDDDDDEEGEDEDN